jgi:hypothetical protein
VSTQEVFVCETCGKGFQSHMALIGHEGYHQNSGRYECELCSAEGKDVFFSLPQGLGAHMRAKHGIKGGGDSNERKRRYREKQKRKIVVAGVLPLEPVEVSLNEENLNGSGEMATVIEQAFQPLADRYRSLQARQAELSAEQTQVEADLILLWEVLQRWEGNLTPPPKLGVQVAFQKVVSDSLSERAENWLRNRRTAFTVTDLSRGVACSNSSASHLINLLRDRGNIRLIGKKRHANAYVSTIDGG